MSSNHYIEKMKELIKEVTPGPWVYDGEIYILSVAGKSEQMVAEIRGAGARLPMDKNAEFISSARTFVPAILSELERVQKENKFLKERLDANHKYREREEVQYLSQINEIEVLLKAEYRNSELSMERFEQVVKLERLLREIVEDEMSDIRKSLFERAQKLLTRS